MSKQEVIKTLTLHYGEPLPSKKWWLHEDGEIMELEGVSFTNNSDYWWFLDEDGEPINSNWNDKSDPDDYPSIHQDLLFEDEKEAIAVARSYCQDMVSRYNDRFVNL